MDLLASEIMNLRKRGKNILYCSVRHHDTVLMDQWFETLNPEEPLPVFSVSKTVTALLVGKALEQGFIKGLDAPIREMLPEYGDLIPEKLMLHHILTMTAGYEWPEIETFGSPDGVFRQLLNAEDPARFILERPLVASPGEKYAYSSGLSHLLMILLNRVTGINPQAYAREVLWDPLGIPDWNWAWSVDRRGIPYGGHGLSLTAEGMNRLGRLMMEKGRVGTKRLISELYMEALSKVQVTGTRGYLGYGFQTWIGELEGNRFYAAFGHGGQRIYIFPELELQVVFMCRKLLPEFGIHERLIRLGILKVI